MSDAPIEFINYRGKALKVLPLTLAQQEELLAYLRFKYINEAKKMFDGLPLELAKYALDKAKTKADRIYPGTDEHSQQFFQPAGLVYGLHLALQASNPHTIEEAYSILDEAPEATEAAARAVGYKGETKKPTNNNKPLPIDEILHVLCNEPYNHTPAEVRHMTIDDIALIWCRPDEQPVYTQADQDRWFAEAAARREQLRLGIWAEDKPIWK